MAKATDLWVIQKKEPDQTTWRPLVAMGIRLHGRLNVVHCSHPTRDGARKIMASLRKYGPSYCTYRVRRYREAP